MVQHQESFRVLLCEYLSPVIQKMLVLKKLLSTSTDDTGIHIVSLAIEDRLRRRSCMLSQNPDRTRGFGSESIGDWQ